MAGDGGEPRGAGDGVGPSGAGDLRGSGGEGDPSGDAGTVEFDAVGASRLPPLRQRRRPLRRIFTRTRVLTVLLIVVIGGVAAGVWAEHQHKLGQRPIVSARRVVEPIAGHDAAALKRQISGGSKRARAAATATTRFFKGWSIDAASVRVHRADDNDYTMAFHAHRPDGTLAKIRGYLSPDTDAGTPPWKLTNLWVDHGRGKKVHEIFPRGA